MNKSIIVYGPQGCGKTRYAERIAKHFGLDLIVDEGIDGWDGNTMNAFGSLYLCVQKPSGWFAAHAISFAEVAQQINAAIPLTDWQSGPPPMVGEWNASKLKLKSSRRWWNGNAWSFAWDIAANQKYANEKAGVPYDEPDKHKIQWRGLSEEPIIVR